MEQLWRDIGFGCRMFWRRPGFTAAAVLSLVLGIGLSTAVYTLWDAVFGNPLPMVEDPDSLYTVYMSRRNEDGQFVARQPHSYPNYLDMQEETGSFSGFAAHFWWPMNFTGGSEPIRTAGMFVSASYFDVLGLEPAHGRFFLPEEDENPGTHPVAVLSHSCWARLFGSDPGILGESVLVNGQGMTVVGVGPPGFSGTLIEVEVDFWLPLVMFPEISSFGQWFEARGGSLFNVFGRLRDGVSPEAAEAELTSFYENIEAAYAADFVGFEGVGALVRPLLGEGLFQSPTPVETRTQYLRYVRRLRSAVFLLLLIACLNVASLLLVRGLERAREIAIRRSLGGERRRLLRQLLTENLVLFVAGGALALPAGWLTMKLLWRLRPPEFAAGGPQLELDAGVAAFALGMALVTGLVFGLWPAVRGSRADMVAHLKETGAQVPSGGAWARRLDLRRLLVGGQVAITLWALIFAGLCLGSLRDAYAIDLGFDAESLVSVSFAPGEQGYDPERTAHFYRQVLERTRSLPGVSSATLSENRLLRGAMVRRQVFVSGDDQALVMGGREFHRVNSVVPGFFETAGIPLLEGRDFDDSMREDGPQVAIVNQTMAETLWPGESAIGRTLRFDYPQPPDIEIIGVARDAKYREIHEERQFFIYRPLAQVAPSYATLHARTEGDPSTLLEVLRREVHEVDPTLPLADVHTMTWFVDENLWKQRTAAQLSGVFGLLALALATLGVYGVLAQTVAQRRREIGVRLAVGARGRDLLRWVLRDGAGLIAAAIAIGLVSAVLLSPVAVSRGWIDAEAVDPKAYAGAALLLAVVALLGCLIPARRATRVDPVKSLREE